VRFEAPPGFAIDTVDSVDSVPAAQCALAALRDGLVGSVSWGASARGSPGVSMSTRLFVRPGRVALSSKFRGVDLQAETLYGYARLKDPAYFESCANASEASALFACLQAADESACSDP
jgi:hypothetical protein